MTEATFTETFQTFVCEGDRIDTEIGGYTVTARIVRDDCPDAPDERQDGFWPSLYKDSAGFIGETDQELVRGTNSPSNGPNWRERFDSAQARAKDIMRAWKADEWFYCGIVLSVSLEGIVLETHAASLWGIEANYPDSGNACLTEVANELLPEALDAGRAIAARILAALS